MSRKTLKFTTDTKSTYAYITVKEEVAYGIVKGFREGYFDSITFNYSDGSIMKITNIIDIRLSEELRVEVD